MSGVHNFLPTKIPKIKNKLMLTFCLLGCNVVHAYDTECIYLANQKVEMLTT